MTLYLLVSHSFIQIELTALKNYRIVNKLIAYYAIITTPYNDLCMVAHDIHRHLSCKEVIYNFKTNHNFKLIVQRAFEIAL